MEVKQQTSLSFAGVDFVNVNVNLHNPIPPGTNPLVDLSIVPKVSFPKERPKEFIIIFEIKLTNKEYFNIAIVAFGFFIFPDLGEKDIRTQKDFININAPAIMFPYVRSFISTLTSNLGTNFNPLLLPPQFFAGDLPEHEELTKENQATPQPPK